LSPRGATGIPSLLSVISGGDFTGRGRRLQNLEGAGNAFYKTNLSFSIVTLEIPEIAVCKKNTDIAEYMVFIT
jgi:hypothetical protein